jgi:thioredoxin 1
MTNCIVLLAKTSYDVKKTDFWTDVMTSCETLQEAYLWLKAGDRARARVLLMEVIEQNPDEAEAWVGLSFCVHTAWERKKCLERALQAEPGHRYARAALARLEAVNAPAASPSSALAGKKGGLAAVYWSLLFVVVCFGGVILLAFLYEKPFSPPAEVAALQPGQYLFIDFYADWCGPCRSMAPIVSELERDCRGSSVKVIKVNTDSSSSDALVRRYNVSAIPRYLLVDSAGKVKQDWVGSGPASMFDPVRKQCNAK